MTHPSNLSTTIITLLTLLCTTTNAITIPDLSLPFLSRSELCPIVLDHDPPLTRRILNLRSPLAPAPLNSQATRIINGDPASPKLVPYLVAIFKFDQKNDIWSSHCSGTLISSRWILSAAFCNVTTADKLLLLGTNLADFERMNSESPTVADVATVINHPNYEKTESGSRFDIAAIQLTKDAPKDTKFMKVNVNSALPETESFARVAGFGVTETELTNPNPFRNLLQVDVPITTFEQCYDAFQPVSGVSINRDFHVCAGYLKKGQCDSCQGDSGGPLMQYNEAGEPVLMGIVSQGAGCGLRGLPGVYIRTSSFESWMDKEAGLEYGKARSVNAQFDGGISTGVVIGISVGVAALALVVVIIVVVFTRKWMSERKVKELDPPEGLSAVHVPSTVDTGAAEWNNGMGPAGPKYYHQLAAPSQYTATQPQYPPPGPQWQPSGSPIVGYASTSQTISSPTMQQSPFGPGYSPNVGAIDYSHVGQPHEYRYRGQTEGSVDSPSARRSERRTQDG